MNAIEKMIVGLKDKTLALNKDESRLYTVDFKKVLPGAKPCHQYEITLVAAREAENMTGEQQPFTLTHDPLKGALKDALLEAGFALLGENESQADIADQSPLRLRLLKRNFAEKGYTVREGGIDNLALHDEEDRLVATIVGGGEGFIMNQKPDENYLVARYRIRAILEDGLEEVRVVQAAVKRDADMEYEGLPVGWKQIAAFAGVLLGLKVMQRGVEYATWREDADGRGVSWGQYFSNFQKAKENFAFRSGIVRAENLFTETEMKIIMDGLVQLGQMDAVADGLVTDAEMDRYAKIIEEIRRRFPDIEITLAEQNQVQREEISEKGMEIGV